MDTTETTTTTRPEIVENDMLVFLDRLRESGVTNMWGASPYVAEMFELNKRDAGDVLGYWMKTFGRDDR